MDEKEKNIFFSAVQISLEIGGNYNTWKFLK